MRKKLLSLVVSTLFFGTVSNAQTVWDFGNSDDWPVNGGYSTNVVVQNLGMFPGESVVNLGEVETNGSGTFSDGYTGTKRFKLNGASYETSATDFQMPTKRYVYFAVNGACTVKVWFRTGGSGNRILYVTDGVNIINSIGSTTSGDRLILTANYTGTAGNLYIAANQACNILKIEVTGSLGTTTLETDNFQKKLTADVFSNGKNVFVSNVQSETEISVYSITGQLVKSFKTTSDTDFQLNHGLYVVRAKSNEGEKAVKVFVN